MTPYVFLIFIWLMLYYYLIYRPSKLTEHQLEQRNKIYVILAGISLFVIMGFRHKYVGVDTTQYLLIYDSSPYYQWNRLTWENFYNQEIGFKAYNYILTFFRIPHQIYLMIYALFVTVCVSKMIHKYCKNRFLGFYLHLTIGLFTMSMSGIRQSIACCICWLAIDDIMEKRPVRFVCLVVLASLFHQSAIFFLAFYFARYIKIKKLSGWIISGFTVLCIALRPVLMPILSFFLPERYEKYGLVSDKYPVNPLVVLIALLIPMFCLFFWERHKLKNETEEQFSSLCYAGSFCYAIITVLSLSSQAIGRMNMYFYLFNVILLGNTISDIEDRNTRYIAAFFAFILPGYMFFKAHSLGIAPYYFFWETYGM